MGMWLLFKIEHDCNIWVHDDITLDGKSALGGSNDMSSGHTHAMWWSQDDIRATVKVINGHGKSLLSTLAHQLTILCRSVDV